MEVSSTPLDGWCFKKRPEMRVLIVTGSFPPMKCGVGDYTYSLAKALAADPGMDVAVLTSLSGGKVPGIDVFPIVRDWSLFELPRVVETIKKWAPDIIHVQHPTQGYGKGYLPWLVPMIGFTMGKKVAQTWHELYRRHRLARKLFLQAFVPGILVVVRPNYRESLPFLLRWAVWGKKFAFIRNASAIPKAELSDFARDELRNQYLKGQKRLIVFFGFVHPVKGVELLFEIADPCIDHIVIAGELSMAEGYSREIRTRAFSMPWDGKVTITGFLSPDNSASLLAVADAVILPFRLGGGEWNTSIHGAVLQGTFVVTASKSFNGYDEKHNVYYAQVDNVQEMKAALSTYAGRRRKCDPEMDESGWKEIANKHHSLYESLLS